MINESVSKDYLNPWIPTRQFARQLRTRETPAEKFLWSFLRGRQRLGYRFRRQHAIHRWIVDFYCARAQVAVEVDGTWHELRREFDLARDRNLDRFGILVLRLSNDLVLRNIDSALGQIEWALTAHRPGRRSLRTRGRRIQPRTSIRGENTYIRALRANIRGCQIFRGQGAVIDAVVTERRRQTLSTCSRMIICEEPEAERD